MYCTIRNNHMVVSPIIFSMLQQISYIEVQVDRLLRYAAGAMDKHHILFSFSNHSLVTSASELHRSASVLSYYEPPHLYSLLSLNILSILQRVSYIEVQV